MYVYCTNVPAVIRSEVRNSFSDDNNSTTSESSRPYRVEHIWLIAVDTYMYNANIAYAVQIIYYDQTKIKDTLSFPSNDSTLSKMVSTQFSDDGGCLEFRIFEHIAFT